MYSAKTNLPLPGPASSVEEYSLHKILLSKGPWYESHPRPGFFPEEYITIKCANWNSRNKSVRHATTIYPKKEESCCRHKFR